MTDQWPTADDMHTVIREQYGTGHPDAETDRYRLTYTGRRALAVPAPPSTVAAILARWDDRYDAWTAGTATSPSVDDLAADAADALGLAHDHDLAANLADILDAGRSLASAAVFAARVLTEQ